MKKVIWKMENEENDNTSEFLHQCLAIGTLAKIVAITFKKSVAADVTRIRNHPLVPGDIPIYGYVYDVTTGRLVEVPEATVAGKAG